MAKAICTGKRSIPSEATTPPHRRAADALLLLVVPKNDCDLPGAAAFFGNGAFSCFFFLLFLGFSDSAKHLST